MQSILIFTTLLASWLGMQAVHEFGHVCGAWLTGGQVERVVLNPLTISRTDLASNPQPLAVVWAGPLLGVLLPLLFWLVASVTKVWWTFLLRFFAGFCCIANGLYIGIGSFYKIGDCGEMLKHGAQPWQLWLFGIVTVPIGFYLWHKQGVYFGLSDTNRAINRPAIYISVTASIVLVLIGFLIGGK